MNTEQWKQTTTPLHHHHWSAYGGEIQIPSDLLWNIITKEKPNIL